VPTQGSLALNEQYSTILTTNCRKFRGKCDDMRYLSCKKVKKVNFLFAVNEKSYYVVYLHYNTQRVKVLAGGLFHSFALPKVAFLTYEVRFFFACWFL
jgi:hypothetical protein